MITLAIHCMNYERRLCWLLSSMLEQTCREFVVDVACLWGAGTPATDGVVEFFCNKGLRVSMHAYAGSEIARFEQRGYTRNDQLAACQTPWIWFADCDHVYHPEYVSRLLEELKNHEHETRLLTAGRISTTSGVDPFPFPHAKPLYHENAFARANAYPDMHKGGAIGAGHTQIVKIDNLPGQSYVPEGENRDHKWSERGHKTRSDQQFRKKVGGCAKLPRWFTYNQVHLNHRRDAHEGGGRHLTEQR